MRESKKNSNISIKQHKNACLEDFNTVISLIKLDSHQIVTCVH